MHTFADGLFEMEMHKKKMETEMERLRWMRLAEAARPRTESEWSVRRVALWLGDMAAGLRCQLRHRFAAAPASMVC